MACNDCGAARGHLNGCPQLEGRPGRKPFGSRGRGGGSGGKGGNCPICGKKMVRFENPERYACLTSDKDHEKIIKAGETSERSQRGRSGIGNRALRDRDRERKARLKGQTRGGGRKKRES